MKGVAAALAGLLLWATPAAAQSAPAPLITVRLGAVTKDEVCQLSRQSSTIGPTMGASSMLLTSRDLCRRSRPIRVKRAQRLTVTLREPAAAIGASLHSGAATAQLAPRPVGPAPGAKWFLDVPRVSGSLVLVVWYPQVIGADGVVAQDRRDFKVRIRRPPGTRITPNPPPAPGPVPAPVPQAYDDSG
jgi:hypothetical protein